MLLSWKGTLALEDYVRETRALIQSLRAQADALEKGLKEFMRLQTEPSRVLIMETGHLLRKPDGWNVADDIQRMLENGKKTMPRDELIKTLVENDLVKGATPPVRIAAARRAITMGKLKGYLRIKDELVHWVPGIYENPRLRKNM